MELIRKILRHTEKLQNDGGWRAYPLNFPSEFGDVGWDVLDQHIALARDKGFVNVKKTNTGWEVYSLTADGMLAIEPTEVDAMLEQNEILRDQVEVIRQSSKRAQIVAWCGVAIASVSMLIALVALFRSW